MDRTEIDVLRDETKLNRDRYHTLSGEVAVVKGRVEMAEDKLGSVQEMSTTLQVLEERVSSWMESTTEYRKSLCLKLDDLKQRMNDLPCKERRVFYDSIAKQMAFLWVVVSAIMLALMASGMSVIFKR